MVRPKIPEDQKNRGVGLSFYIQREDFPLVKAFDRIAMKVKKSNRSKQIISLMKGYVKQYEEHLERRRLEREESKPEEGEDGQQ